MKTQCFKLKEILYDNEKKQFFITINNISQKHYICDEAELIALFYACNVESLEQLQEKLAEQYIDITFQFLNSKTECTKIDFISFFVSSSNWYVIKTGMYVKRPLTPLL